MSMHSEQKPETPVHEDQGDQKESEQNLVMANKLLEACDIWTAEFPKWVQDDFLQVANTILNQEGVDPNIASNTKCLLKLDMRAIYRQYVSYLSAKAFKVHKEDLEEAGLSEESFDVMIYECMKTFCYWKYTRDGKWDEADDNTLSDSIWLAEYNPLISYSKNKAWKVSTWKLKKDFGDSFKAKLNDYFAMAYTDDDYRKNDNSKKEENEEAIAEEEGDAPTQSSNLQFN